MYGANVPLKDYGKRKPNDAVDSVQQQQPAAKRMKHDTTTTDHPSSSGEHSKQEDSKNQKKKKKGKMQPQQSNASNSSNGQFDYGQVDFKKFRGGSHQAKRNVNEVQTKFHGKVNVANWLIFRFRWLTDIFCCCFHLQNKHHANTKKFNKLFTFGGMQNKGQKKK